MTWERDRDRGYEEQFARREEHEFKVAAHRNRLLALWAAAKMKFGHRQAQAYAQSIATADVAHVRSAKIAEQIFEDLKAAGVDIAESDVRAEFARLDAQAAQERRQV